MNDSTREEIVNHLVEKYNDFRLMKHGTEKEEFLILLDRLLEIFRD